MTNDFLKATTEAFDLKELAPGEVAPLILAYIGDAVYEVVIRTYVINGGNRAMKSINKDSRNLVNAGVQAKMADALLEKFTEEEAAQYRRGRNAKSGTCAKNASIGDYRKATGFEAVMGFLYLSGKNDRMVELCKLGLEAIEN